jgi:hypothetical protein
VAPSVSGTAERWRRPALSGRMGLVNWQEAGLLVTVVVRCNPVVRGPDVAPAVPSLEGASRHSTQPGSCAVGPAQRASRPTVVVREGSMLRARGGHGRRGRVAQTGSNGLQLDRRVRPVLGDDRRRGQAPEGCAAERIHRALPAGGLRRESSCYSLHGILGSPSRRAGSAWSHALAVSQFGLQRRPPVLVGQLWVCAEDCATTMLEPSEPRTEVRVTPCGG